MTLFPQSFVSFLHRALCFDNRLHLDSRQVYNRIIYFLFQHIYLIELRYFLDSPWWDSWLWASCDLPVSRLCPDCAASAGHQARPWPPLVTSLEKASKCPQIFTDRAQLEWIKWVSLNYSPSSSIHCFHPTNNVSLPPAWQAHYWAINRNNNYNQIRNQ